MLYTRFQGVSDEWDIRAIRRAARAYLLYLLGSTLFADKSKSHVHLSLLWPLRVVEEVNTYSWGSATLAFLHRQLGLASCIGVKQMDDCFFLYRSFRDSLDFFPFCFL